eukprot:1430-Heterococcus_DN1.PRE.2
MSLAAAAALTALQTAYRYAADLVSCVSCACKLFTCKAFSAGRLRTAVHDSGHKARKAAAAACYKRVQENTCLKRPCGRAQMMTVGASCCA